MKIYLAVCIYIVCICHMYVYMYFLTGISLELLNNIYSCHNNNANIGNCNQFLVIYTQNGI